MYSKILVPCDVSYEYSAWLNPAITMAWKIAENFGGVLYFLTVVPENLLKGFYPDIHAANIALEARKSLESIVDNTVPDTSGVELMVREGGIASEIIHAARELPADLIVMASHGPLLRDYLLGSNASHVALHVPCSVYIVRSAEIERRAA